MNQRTSDCITGAGIVNARVSAPAVDVGKFVAWLFGLAPVLLFALTWSEDLSDLQRMVRSYALPVVGIELAVIYISFRQGLQLPKFKRSAFFLLAALGVLVWATAAAAASPATSLLRTGIWTTHLLFGLAIVNLFRLGMFDFAAHIQTTLCGFLIFFAMLVVFIATTEQTAQERIFDLPAFSNIRWFGYYAAAVIGLSASGFVQRNRLALFTATIAFAMAFWTGTRGAVAASAVGLLAGTILFREFRSPRPWLLFASCGLAGFVIALGLDTLLALGDQGPGSMGRYDDSGRIEVWRATLQLIQAQPWVGHGDGQFKLPIGETLIIAQPHNIVLQILHAWGIIGGLLCLALVTLTAPAFLASKSPHSAPFRCGALILGAYSFIDGALFYNQSLSLFALCCAAAVASGLSAERGNAASPETPDL